MPKRTVHDEQDDHHADRVGIGDCPICSGAIQQTKDGKHPYCPECGWVYGDPEAPEPKAQTDLPIGVERETGRLVTHGVTYAPRVETFAFSRASGTELDFEMSPTIGRISLALSKAQGEMKRAKKSADNPYFSSKYADLGEIVETSREPLANNELAVVQVLVPTGKEGHWLRLITMLVHSSGEWFRSVAEWPVMPQERRNGPPIFNAQAYMSTETYIRRGAWAAITGVATEDDDGEGGSGHPEGHQNPRQTYAAPTVREQEGWFPNEKQVKLVWGKAQGRAKELCQEGTEKKEINALAEQITREAVEAVCGPEVNPRTIPSRDQFDAVLVSIEGYRRS